MKDICVTLKKLQEQNKQTNTNKKHLIDLFLLAIAYIQDTWIYMYPSISVRLVILKLLTFLPAQTIGRE